MIHFDIEIFKAQTMSCGGLQCAVETNVKQRNKVVKFGRTFRTDRLLKQILEFYQKTIEGQIRFQIFSRIHALIQFC